MRVVGVKEVARLLGWEPAKVSTYLKRGKLPKPIQMLASGPVWTEAQIQTYKELSDMGKQPVLVELLAHEMVNVLGPWIGTPSEELLEDGGTVRDWLRNESEALREVDLEEIPKEYWDAAWDIFDRVTEGAKNEYQVFPR